MRLRIGHLSLANRVQLLLIAVLSLVVAVEISMLDAGSTAEDLSALQMTDGEDLLTDAGAVNPPGVPPLADYSEITGRPLFNESRRRIAHDVAPAVATRRTSQLSTQWRLTGVVMTGDSSFVLLEGKRDRRMVRLQKGAILDGWRLGEITAERVNFVSDAGARSVSLDLHEEDSKKR